MGKKDSIKVEMWAGELGMFVIGVVRHGSIYGSMEKGNRYTGGRKGKRGMAEGMNEKSTLEW